MTVNRSQTLEISHEAHGTRPTVDTSLSGNAPVSTAHGIRISSNPNYHTAFMQCRSCCNCNSQCSYYGKGFFDAQGNYVGS